MWYVFKGQDLSKMGKTELYVRLILIVGWACSVLTSNIETGRYHQLYPEKTSTEYFGFGASTATVTSRVGNTMYVGAPYQGGRINNVPFGALYVCPVPSGSNQRCDRVLATEKGGAIGISVDQLSSTGEATVCGSLFEESCPDANVQQRMIGVCYKYKNQFEELPTPCTWACPNWVELMLVVDDSLSVGWSNFRRGLTWILDILANFRTRIQSGEFRVGLILFSDRVSLEFRLSLFEKDYTGLTDAIGNIVYLNGGSTWTGSAIQTAQNELSVTGRRAAAKLLIVLTDGESNGVVSVKTAAEQARAAGTVTVGVGVGNFKQSQINDIAGAPNRNLTVSDYNSLGTILASILAIIQETASTGLEGSTSNSTNDVSQCQLGFSSSTSTNKLFLGSVGSYDRIGTIMGYPTPVSKTTNPQLLNITGLETLAKPESLTQLKETYLGYSVTNGKFQGGNIEFVASGEPRYNSKGRVLIIESNQLSLPASNYHSLHPFGAMWQLGAYFGQSVLAADVNNDNFDDLLVSAPLYSNQGGYDQGRVFVFMNNPTNPGPQYWKAAFNPLVLVGSNAIGSRFGMSISRVGDVDQNGYDDVLIGAPMESRSGTESGAVYLYYGSSTGLSELHKQKILGSSVAPSLVNFGYSVTKGAKQGIDVDGNKYPDLLISAPSSDKVIILRSRPVVDVTASVTITPPSVDLMTCLRSIKCATVQVCIQTQQRATTSNIFHQMVTKLSLDDLFLTATGKRIQFADNSTTATTLTNNRVVDRLSRCYSYDIRLNTASYAPTGALSSLPLIIKYSYDFTKAHKNTLQSAVLDPIGATFVQAEWLLSTGCSGNNQRCIHDLGLSAVFSIPASKNAHVIENAPGLMTATVTISNAGPDHSFFTRMVVSSTGLSINKITSTCAIKSNTLSVEGNGVIVMNNLASVLMRGEKCTVTLSYSLEDLRLTATIKALTINGRIFSGRNESSDPSSGNDVITYDLPIKYRVDLVPGGTSFPIEAIFFNHSTSADYVTSLTDSLLGGNLTNIQHTMTIENRGKNLLSSAWFDFTWPESTKDGFPLLYLYDFKCLPLKYCVCDFANKVNKQKIPMYDNGIFNLSIKFPTKSQAILSSQPSCSSVSCGVITCQIFNQPEFTTVTVSAQYKLWLPSLAQPDLSTTLSSVILLNTSASPIYPQSGAINIQVPSLVKAFVLGGPQTPANGGSNIGAIIGAIIGGVALLAIIGLLLWKFGFFENKYRDLIAEARAQQEGAQASDVNNVSSDVAHSTADLIHE